MPSSPSFLKPHHHHPLLLLPFRHPFSTHPHPWDPPPPTLFNPPLSSGSHTQGDSTILSLALRHSSQTPPDIPSLLLLLRHMRHSLPLRPNPFPEYLFPPFFRAFSASRNPDRALHLFDTMLPHFGCPPTFRSLNSALSVLSLHRPDLAYGFFQKAVRDHPGCNSPNVLTFNLLIRAAVRQGRADDGVALLREMVRRRMRPDGYSYSTVIDGLCRERRTEEAMGLLDEMNVCYFFLIR